MELSVEGEGVVRKMTDTQTETFIELFQERPCLLRTTSREYSERNAQWNAATEIGGQMNISGV